MKNIEIKGTIVPNDDVWIYDYFEIENTSPEKVKKALEEAEGDEITVQVNSGGGDVFAGNEIYYLLANYNGRTVVDIVGFAASIATVICCAGDTVRSNPGAQYMIHNVSMGAAGDYHAMDHASQVLQSANKSISNVYQIKTGLKEDELLALMDEETWMDAKRAKELGFVDEIIGDAGLFNSRPITINNGVAKILSDEVKDKIRAEKAEKENAGHADDLKRQKSMLDFLRLKGEKKNV